MKNRWSVSRVQISVGVFALTIVTLLAFKHTFYVSEWHSFDSNFYSNTTDALRQSNISFFQGSIPTLIVFWEMDCSECLESLQDLKSSAAGANIVGIHLKTEESNKVDARRWWLQHASKESPIYFDDNNMLENTFLIRTTPTNFLFFPKVKKVLGHAGNIKWASPSISQIMVKNNP